MNEEIWDELHTTKCQKASFLDKIAPISQVGSSVSLENEIEQEEQVWDCRSNTLATLPSYWGQQDDKSIIIPIPTHQIIRLWGSINELVETLVNQKFQVELSLKEIASLKPKLWQQLVHKLGGNVELPNVQDCKTMPATK